MSELAPAESRTRTRYQYLTDQRWFVRTLEIIPGLTTWTFLIAPIVLSFFVPVVVAYFIVAFDLYWMLKALRLGIYLTRGYRRLRLHAKIHWRERLDWLDDPARQIKNCDNRLKTLLDRYPKARRTLQLTREGIKNRDRYLRLVADLDQLKYLERHQAATLRSDQVYHAVIVALYNEGREILEPTIKGVMESDYDIKHLMLFIAYEERGGEEAHELAHEMIAKYGPKFAYAEAVMHPDGLPGEARGKGGNINFTGRRVAEYVEQQGMDPEQVVVTTLDSDNMPDPQYFAYLTYAFASNPNRMHRSFQPVPMFYNNIWDAPAPMRVIATGNTFWQLIEMMRPHRLRNFSAHAQSLKALIATDFWNAASINEDGHQYWRSFFTFDGDHEVVPLYMPVYQDAVLAETYPKTIMAQYKQLQRWAYGVTDFPYVVIQSIRNKHIPLWSRLVGIGRLFEGHFSWATSALVITFVAWLPLFLNERFSRTQELAHQLPVIASRLQTIALIGLFITASISYISLPPKPARYGHRRRVGMILQWVLLPVTGILFNSLAAIDSQTRLMFGRYLDWVVTTKSRRQ